MQFTKFFPSTIFKSSNISVGLDIGNFSVKVAQIKQRRFPKEQYLSFAIKEVKKEKSRDAVVEAIKEASSEARIESNKVNISVYGPQMVMRYITLPSLDLNELSKCLEFELERYMPGKKRENMAIDYKILYRLLNNQMVVFLIALERQIIEERISLIRDAGLQPNSVNVDSLALMNAYNAAQLSGRGAATAILDIGHVVSKLVVFQGDNLYFSRDINYGIYNLIQRASERMNIDFTTVNELGTNLADKSKDLYIMIKTSLNDLVDELRLSFEYCLRHLQKRIDQLYLSGGGARPKIIEEILSTNLNLKAHSLDVTRRFKLASSVKREDLKECSSLLAVAVGLATG